MSQPSTSAILIRRGSSGLIVQMPGRVSISLLRKGNPRMRVVLVVCNFTPVPRPNYRIGAPYGGFWKEVLNSDATQYGGRGWGNLGGIEAVPIPLHGRTHSITLTLPPLATLYFTHPGRSS